MERALKSTITSFGQCSVLRADTQGMRRNVDTINHCVKTMFLPVLLSVTKLRSKHQIFLIDSTDALANV
jgi:hypothetical protein